MIYVVGLYCSCLLFRCWCIEKDSLSDSVSDLQGRCANGEFQGVVIRTVEHEFGGIFSSVNISLKKHFQIIKLILHINVNMMIY